MKSESKTMRPLALVTGAASSLGLELAKKFAMNGFDLMISAEVSDLEGPRDILMDLGAEVFLHQADLSKFSGVDSLHKEIRKNHRPLEAVAIIVGAGSDGFFEESELRDDLELIRRNVMSSVHLTKLILPQMIEAGSGRILFIRRGQEMNTVDGATRGFLNSFSEGLKNELKTTGVSVTACLPRTGNASDEELAHRGFIALLKGKDHIRMKVKEWARSYV